MYALSEPSTLPSLKDREVFLDTEGTGVHKMDDRPTLLIFKVGGKNYAAPWSPKLSVWLSDQLPLAAKVICHYAKHDIHMMLNAGVDPDAIYGTPFTCTMVRMVLCNEHYYSYSLDNLCLDLFGIGKDDSLYVALANAFGGKPDAETQMPNLCRVPMDETNPLFQSVLKYAFRDLNLTEKLYRHQEPIIQEEDLTRIVSLEEDVTKALVEMERRGVMIDVEGIDTSASQLKIMAEKYRSTIVHLIGKDINPRSPKEMKAAFERLGLPIQYTAKGNPTFAADVLASVGGEFCDTLLKARDIKTLLETFIATLRKHNHSGKIHTSFNQVRDENGGTGTGRLSSSGPNLQQVPKRKSETAQLIRSLFIPAEGMTWMSADWEQFEFRMFGHYANDRRLIERYNEDPSVDFHQTVADMTGVVRGSAKRINLGLIFGMGQGKLAKELGLPYTIETTDQGKEIFVAGPEAISLFETYHGMFPAAKEFLRKAENSAKRNGYVRTFGGRKIRFPKGGHHKAGGLVFQGSSADVMKRKLVELNRTYRNTPVGFILVVHDEFDFMVPHELVDSTKATVKEIVEDCGLRIPILSKIDCGPNWWEASK